MNSGMFGMFTWNVYICKSWGSVVRSSGTNTVWAVVVWGWWCLEWDLKLEGKKCGTVVCSSVLHSKHFWGQPRWVLLDIGEGLPVKVWVDVLCLLWLVVLCEVSLEDCPLLWGVLIKRNVRVTLNLIISGLYNCYQKSHLLEWNCNKTFL